MGSGALLNRQPYQLSPYKRKPRYHFHDSGAFNLALYAGELSTMTKMGEEPAASYAGEITRY